MLLCDGITLLTSLRVGFPMKNLVSLLLRCNGITLLTSLPFLQRVDGNLNYDMLVMYYNANCTRTHRCTYRHVKKLHKSHALPWLIVHLLFFFCLVHNYVGLFKYFIYIYVCLVFLFYIVCAHCIVISIIIYTLELVILY